MLYYDRIGVSEGTDVNETSESKECDMCHYWYFLNHTGIFSTICLQWLSWSIDDVYEP